MCDVHHIHCPNAILPQPCPGGATKPCSGHGDCKGDGQRFDNGACQVRRPSWVMGRLGKLTRSSEAASVYMYACLPLRLPTWCIYINLGMRVPLYICIHLDLCLSASISTCLPLCVSLYVCLRLRLRTCAPVCTCVCRLLHVFVLTFVFLCLSSFLPLIESVCAVVLCMTSLTLNNRPCKTLPLNLHS